MPKMMKAAVVERFGEPLKMREIRVPDPGPGQVLVEIANSGVCHTDLHAADGDWPMKPTLPFIPGHEGAGIVAAVGAGVTHLKEGDRVGIAWLHSACGHCEFCLGGWETLCHEQQNSGFSVNGTFAEYALGAARITSAAFPTPCPSGMPPRSCAQASPPTKDSSRRKCVPANGSSSPESAVSVTLPCSTRRPWGCMSPPSTSDRKKCGWRASSEPRSQSMPASRIR